jgi:hypothetical protein
MAGIVSGTIGAKPSKSISVALLQMSPTVQDRKIFNCIEFAYHCVREASVAWKPVGRSIKDVCANWTEELEGEDIMIDV